MYNKLFSVISFVLLHISSYLICCPIILHNNSTLPLLVFEQINAQTAYINPGNKLLFGTKTSHPNLFVGQYSHTNEVNCIQYNLAMTGCALSTEPIVIKYSDLASKNVPSFFTLTTSNCVTENKPRTRNCTVCKKQD